jgi:hypothetical protein
MGDATAWIDDGSDIDGSTMSIVVIAAWRVHKSNLVHRGVDVEMSTYSRATQSRSVMKKKNAAVDG